MTTATPLKILSHSQVQSAHTAIHKESSFLSSNSKITQRYCLKSSLETLEGRVNLNKGSHKVNGPPEIVGGRGMK